jgi:hypothetical protein
VVLNDQAGYSSSEGTTQTLGTGDEVTFTLPTGSGGGSGSSTAPEEHHVTVDAVGSDYADITVASDPISFRLYAGQSKSVDVDRDGHDDLLVRLASVAGHQANLVFRQLAAAVTPSPTPTPTPQARTTSSPDTSSSNLPWAWIFVGVAGAVVVLVIIVVAVVRRASRAKLV